MKKSLATLSLVAALTAGLVSCGQGYDYKDGVMLTVNGKEYTTAELYEKYGLDTSAGVEAYYNIVKDIVTEAVVKKTETMIDNVEGEMNSVQQNAESSAKTNGTNTAEEIEKTLESEGVDSLEELEAKKYLAAKTTKLSEDFYSDNNYKNTYLKQALGTASEDPENSKYKIYPYHLSHILVKVDATSTSLWNGTISSDDAKQLYSVVSSLVNNNSFGQTALTLSDDGSASTYGDLGIMDSKTSYVSEFKYNVYTYDALFNDKVSAQNKQEIENKLFSYNETEKAEYKTFVNNKVYGIPYSALLALNYYADIVKDSNGVEVNNSSDINYPRNVIFNNYFNNHSLSYIYLDNPDDSPLKTDTNFSKYYNETIYEAANKSNAFKENGTLTNAMQAYTEVDTNKHTTGVQQVNNATKVLVDTENADYPILVTRAGTGSSSTSSSLAKKADGGTSDSSGYQGIHFISVIKDPFVTTQDELVKYYTLDKPTVGTTNDTFVGKYAYSEVSNYNSRVETIKTEIKKMDSNFDYRMFEEALAKAESGENDNKVKITLNPDVKKAIENYIEVKRETTAESDVRSWDSTWRSYLRSLKVSSEFSSRILPLSAINAFMGGTSSLETYNNQRAGVTNSNTTSK